MSEKVLKAEFGSEEAPLMVAGIPIPCYVLEDGKRVITQTGMIQALGMSSGSASSKKEGDRLSKFVQGKRIKSLIDNDIIPMIENPLRFRTTNNKIAYGYDALVLQEIVRSVAKAYLKGELQKQQEHIGKKCEILDDGFSKIGLIALIDEATGYQKVRDRFELHKILDAYVLNKEFLPWTKKFPDEFYEQLFRLKGWSYHPFSIKRPKIVGKITNNLIYKRLPKGVLEKLKEKTPKSPAGNYIKRFHQSLTSDIGNPHLEKQLVAVVTLMRISPNWRTFIRHFNRAFNDVQEFDFVDEVDLK